MSSGLRDWEVCQIQSAGLTRGPAVKLSGLRVERISVEWRFRRAEAKGDVASLLPSFNGSNNAERQFGTGPWLASRGVEQVDHACAVLICDQRNRAPI